MCARHNCTEHEWFQMEWIVTPQCPTRAHAPTTHHQYHFCTMIADSDSLKCHYYSNPHNLFILNAIHTNQLKSAGIYCCSATIFHAKKSRVWPWPLDVCITLLIPLSIYSCLLQFFACSNFCADLIRILNKFHWGSLNFKVHWCFQVTNGAVAQRHGGRSIGIKYSLCRY